MDAFLKACEKPDACPAFAKYFRENYLHCYDRWMRCVYLSHIPRELHHLFPTGTQMAESFFSKLKEYDFRA